MDDSKKIADKLNMLKGLFEQEKKDIDEEDKTLMNNIRQLPDGPEKKYWNSIRNRLKTAAKNGNAPDEARKLINEIKDKSLNLTNAR